MSAPTREELLRLQRMEMALIRARHAAPDILQAADYEVLRYALGCARLYRFVPGAASGRTRGEEIAVDQDAVAPLRELVLRTLERPLLKEDDYCERQEACAAVMPSLFAAVAAVRMQLLADGRLSAAELDAEAGRKTLCLALGGGGGAGYVYIGAVARLREEGILPGYLVGASIGSLIGAVMAHSGGRDLEGLLSWAKALTMRQIFARPKTGPSYTLPGIMRLHLLAMHELLRHPDGTAVRLGELDIPYEAVVAGIRQRFYALLPDGMVDSFGWGGKPRFSQRVGQRILQLTTLLNPALTKSLVLGRDADTRDVRVADAVGLSCAIPAVLQYEPRYREPVSDAALAALRERENIALFADGGVVDNVPARILWEGVHGGRIGTRNPFVLALDCFSPHWDTHHLWLGPLQQLVQAQLPGQRPYFDWLVRFDRVLSPVNLLPNAADFDRAWRWGWEQMDALVPMFKLALAPVRWRHT